MAKLGRFYEQPLLYVFLIFFSIFIYLVYDTKAGTVLGFLSLAAWALFLTQKPKLRINSTRGNTPTALMIALVALAVSVLLSVIVGVAIFGFTSASIAEFIKYNKSAVLGAETLPFAGNPILTFIVFVIAFPITETVVVLQLFDLILKTMKIPLVISLKNPMIFLVAALIGIGAIFYHIYAKVTVAGAPNANALMIIFFIFFVECLAAAYTKEMEPSIYHHIINNALAIL